MKAHRLLPNIVMVPPFFEDGVPFPESETVLARLGRIRSREATVRILEYVWIKECEGECVHLGADPATVQSAPINSRVFALAHLAVGADVDARGHTAESGARWTIGSAIAAEEKALFKILNSVLDERKARLLGHLGDGPPRSRRAPARKKNFRAE